MERAKTEHDPSMSDSRFNETHPVTILHDKQTSEPKENKKLSYRYQV